MSFNYFLLVGYEWIWSKGSFLEDEFHFLLVGYVIVPWRVYRRIHSWNHSVVNWLCRIGIIRMPTETLFKSTIDEGGPKMSKRSLFKTCFRMFPAARYGCWSWMVTQPVHTEDFRIARWQGDRDLILDYSTTISSTQKTRYMEGIHFSQTCLPNLQENDHVAKKIFLQHSNPIFT